ncbi:uncharacterized protein H6S33_006653 [Morchella sextelata]|uniref:uncharacterized protein n=1 Tax=Morchella sextelata TaxID=1174677 RepID=UPI001D046041|nr:uncharacterized protein H6S33_006653 [Morchella sextelata]KAH0604276.1 hypothetical protein H6S33_006653 [Morchella sextelata]
MFNSNQSSKANGNKIFMTKTNKSPAQLRSWQLTSIADYSILLYLFGYGAYYFEALLIRDEKAFMNNDWTSMSPDLKELNVLYSLVSPSGSRSIITTYKQLNCIENQSSPRVPTAPSCDTACLFQAIVRFLLFSVSALKFTCFVQFKNLNVFSTRRIIAAHDIYI